MNLTTLNNNYFQTQLPISIYSRALGQPETDWQEFDQGPGLINLDQEYEYCVRARNIDDTDLAALCRSLVNCKTVIFINLAENRNVTEIGIAHLASLPWLTRLNLSSCSIHNSSLGVLSSLKKLSYLDLSYCNRISDEGLRHLKLLRNLTYLDIQGCVRITHAGVKRFTRRGLTVHQ